MAIRKVARMGHPVLREKARELRPEEIGSPEISDLIRDLLDTMEEYRGIGLAAPQVHESVRVAIIGLDGGSSRYPDMGSLPLTVFINPVITVLDPTPQAFWEGCLSIPEIRGLVERPRKVRVDFIDAAGESRSITAEGFLATVLQHELDHLDGVLFVDRLKTEPGRTKIAFTEEYARFDLANSEPGAGQLED